MGAAVGASFMGAAVRPAKGCYLISCHGNCCHRSYCGSCCWSCKMSSYGSCCHGGAIVMGAAVVRAAVGAAKRPGSRELLSWELLWELNKELLWKLLS